MFYWKFSNASAFDKCFHERTCENRLLSIICRHLSTSVYVNYCQFKTYIFGNIYYIFYRYIIVVNFDYIILYLICIFILPFMKDKIRIVLDYIKKKNHLRNRLYRCLKKCIHILNDYNFDIYQTIISVKTLN